MDPSNRRSPSREEVQNNYLGVLERVKVAADRSLRHASDIRVVGVTKYVNAEVARWLFELGCVDLAESRPQVLWEKAAALQDLKIRWHLIGHLQRNKAKRTLAAVSAMHSVDSIRILDQIQLDTVDRTDPLQLLLDMNISGDPTKTGMLAAEGEELLKHWKELSDPPKNLAIVGLMGMGSLNGGTEQARHDFESLRKLRDLWSQRYEIELGELSMGMSDDFEAAIEQGSTMVRIGSILFN